jgi:two-component system chemotaxis response regulator CheB
MPIMDGLQTLKEIRKTRPELPVLMFSSYTRQGAEVTIESLLLGAQDYVEKPATKSLDESLQHIKSRLIPKIKSICRRPLKLVSVNNETQQIESSVSPKNRIQESKSVEIVVIGASTGGPNALAEVLSSIPANFPVPILIVQHMPALFTATLAERLSEKCSLDVREAVDGEEISGSCIRLAPGDFHLAVQSSFKGFRAHVFQSAPLHYCRPAVDVLFQSAAAFYGAGVLGVMLTGMGQDGLLGCQSIHDKGGQILTQDEASSVVWGMPGSVVEAGLSNKTLPLSRIGAEIADQVLTHYPKQKSPVFDSSKERMCKL